MVSGSQRGGYTHSRPAEGRNRERATLTPDRPEGGTERGLHSLQTDKIEKQRGGYTHSRPAGGRIREGATLTPDRPEGGSERGLHSLQTG